MNREMLIAVKCWQFCLYIQNISLGEYQKNVERSVRMSGDRVATWMFYVSFQKFWLLIFTPPTSDFLRKTKTV